MFTIDAHDRGRVVANVPIVGCGELGKIKPLVRFNHHGTADRSAREQVMDQRQHLLPVVLVERVRWAAEDRPSTITPGGDRFVRKSLAPNERIASMHLNAIGNAQRLRVLF